MTDFEIAISEYQRQLAYRGEIHVVGESAAWLLNALHDAQAMALVKKLGLTVDPQEDKPPFTWRVVVANEGDWDKQIFSQGSDLNRVIDECAAKIQAAKVAA